MPRHKTTPLQESAIQHSAALDDTLPLPAQSEEFAALPKGALISGHYAVREVRAASDVHNVYLVEDLLPVRECPNCHELALDGQERFCAGCGADLSDAPSVHKRYLVQEQDGTQAFQSEEQLLSMKLAHAGLILPVEVFTESPYAGPRRYRVATEHSAPLASTLPLPQALGDVLGWGISLAQAMVYLHQHQVTIQTPTLDHIAVDGDRAAWTRLDEACVIPPERRRRDNQEFTRDIRGLATSLQMLAIGDQHGGHSAEWPEGLQPLMRRALQHPEELTAATFADELETFVQTAFELDSVTLAVGRRTATGRVRSLNEDSLITLDIGAVYRSCSTPAGLFVVADGMGGHEAGDVASELTARTVAELATKEILGPVSSGQPLPEPKAWLERAAQIANRVVYQQRRAAGNDMGTTLVMALMDGVKATIANVGDSRCYRLHKDGITQITTDHSLVERLVATGQITREEAAIHPQRNVIYRVMGDKPNLSVDIYEEVVRPGEALLLCSDGLSGMVHDRDIWRIWHTSASPQEACDRMVEAANQAGGEDNITVVIVQVET
ncbi:MAG: Stp1/IreP family PP2C-type Ser/Thr phosphatase [Anaerolineae bacterium]